MGWFNSKKETRKKISLVNWVDLTEMTQLDEIIKESELIPVMILKHSTRCSISLMAKNSLDKNWEIDTGALKTYYLDLLKYRPISNQIAEIFNVHHQSPQVLIIKNGKCEYSATHSNINSRSIKQEIK